MLHPALGPLYSIISQKIRRGQLALDSELQLEIAEADIENLTLEGSLLVEAVSPLGQAQANGTIKYGQESRCLLKNVVIRNRGIHRSVTQHYWKNDPSRDECVHIILHEGAEFHAEDTVLEGSRLFEIKPYHRLVLHPGSQGQWSEELTPINQPTWSWHYAFDDDNRIKLDEIDVIR